MTTPRYQAGQILMYWGRLTAYYGKPATVLYANNCSCAHQTYVVQFEDGKRLEKVLESSMQPAE